MTVLILLFAVLCEIGRVMIIREKTQTAADAASLAVARGAATRQVKFTVYTDRGYRQLPCSPDGTCPPCEKCNIQSISMSAFVSEKEWIDEEGWRELIVPPCDCGGENAWFTIDDRTVDYGLFSAGGNVDQNDVRKAREDVFNSLRDSIDEYAGSVLYGPSAEGVHYLLGQTYDFADLLRLTNLDPITLGNLLHNFYVGRYGEKYYYKVAVNSHYEVSRALAKFSNAVASAQKTFNNIQSIPSYSSQYLSSEITGSAGAFYDANAPQEAENSGIVKITVYGEKDKYSPYYPSVVVYAQSIIKSIFPNWFGQEFKTTVCAQGDTYYRDPNSQVETNGGNNKFYGDLSNIGKWSRQPEDACWVDW